MPEELRVFKTIVEELRRDNPVVLAMITSKEGSGPRDMGAVMAVTIDGKKIGSIGGGAVEKYILEEARKALRDLKTRKKKFALRRENIPVDAIPTNQVCGGVVEVMLKVVQPPPRIVVVGAGNIGKPLADMANILGYRVVVLDTDPELANHKRYPYAEHVEKGPVEELVLKYAVKPWHYVIIVYGEVDTDRKTLENLLRKGFPGHIWLLCSRKRAKYTLDKIREAGIDPDKYKDRIHMPAGLDIGADTPAEIAVSILAEVIAVMRGRKPPVRSLSIYS